MRVFVAGASGAIGTRLVPQLIDRGHEVTGNYTSPQKAGRIRDLGAEPVRLDLLDQRAVHEAVLDARPDAIGPNNVRVAKQMRPDVTAAFRGGCCINPPASPLGRF